MSHGFFTVPVPDNEPILNYGPGSPEKASLKGRLDEMAGEQIEIPIIIGGKEIKTGNFGNCVMPHDHGHLLGRYHKADASHVQQAVEAAAEAWKHWSETPWESRAAVFLKAAELLAGPHRNNLNGATMLCQSKNVFQAEIDAACELIDFFRFNAFFMAQLMEEQPMYSPNPTWNRSEYRALEGFILAITPFNFTSIAGNLGSAPAIMGNTVIWKPAASTVYTGYYIMKLLQEAGLPPGVINFVPGPPKEIGDTALHQPGLAGIHFTGSTGIFQYMWRTVGENIANYNGYPRIVGETGGKDFIVAHESAHADALRTAIVRGAFEYQGQKCSAASRAYIPKALWNKIKDDVCNDVNSMKMGDPRDFTNFINAIIDEKAFDPIARYIDYARDADDATIICGGEYDKSKGYFIQPTIIETTNPKFKTMCEEIFGPVMTVYPYEETFEEVLELTDTTSPYALTGAVFAEDRYVIDQASKALRHAAGNFYINDKPTGAVVGQQPFGGARASGTNDKAGSAMNLLRWTSVRSIKENFVPVTDYRYPFLQEP
ncbi:MAG: L-glutamate gamma-semialdehyde dehydrogenase [Acidobacteriota bacterium]|nr:L-glutamate gamma-semialdehyde dehydrogenase [Acidobacteriota bacterium]